LCLLSLSYLFLKVKNTFIIVFIFNRTLHFIVYHQEIIKHLALK
jgi:hypothetical protein